MFDPSVGRWYGEDQLGFAAGDANLYRYVGNHPTNATDPSGLWEKGGNDAFWKTDSGKLLAGQLDAAEKHILEMVAKLNEGGKNDRLNFIKKHITILKVIPKGKQWRGVSGSQAWPDIHNYSLDRKRVEIELHVPALVYLTGFDTK